MGEPQVELIPIDPRRGTSRLAAVGVALAIVAALAFALGLGIGNRTAPPPASPSIVLASPPDFTTGAVSKALYLAYLDGISGGSDWALCDLAPVVRCTSVYAPSSLLFSDFTELPLLVSPGDWQALVPPTIVPGHYILAGPGAELWPVVSFARVTQAGVGMLIGPEGQTAANGIEWADLGTLTAGRYLAVANEYALQADPAGSIAATRIGWAIGFTVAGP